MKGTLPALIFLLQRSRPLACINISAATEQAPYMHYYFCCNRAGTLRALIFLLQQSKHLMHQVPQKILVHNIPKNNLRNLMCNLGASPSQTKSHLLELYQIVTTYKDNL
jgi:hypothetical protein